MGSMRYFIGIQIAPSKNGIGDLVTWRSKKQGVAARSNAEAEFKATTQDICEGLWVHRVLVELLVKIELSLKLDSDIKVAISIAYITQLNMTYPIILRLIDI
ncbi:hypothetical protein MTR_4g084690 [Medicago truncatula]|uniref:Uncharacterized protein n=1 Tax=Medicago truncatula TaxID=3880 RepID=A0A072UYG2_MEDTR|nr:hypothetical protein MTR_4g084690 [Medicago truncatula]